MKNLEKYISGTFLITSLIGLIFTFRNLNVDSEYDMAHNKVEDYILLIFVYILFLQFFYYLILFCIHIFKLIKNNNVKSKHKLLVIIFAFLLGLLYLWITNLIYYKGYPFWGPSGSGLGFVSICSIIINYLYYSISRFGQVVNINKLKFLKL